MTNKHKEFIRIRHKISYNITGSFNSSCLYVLFLHWFLICKWLNTCFNSPNWRRIVLNICKYLVFCTSKNANGPNAARKTPYEPNESSASNFPHFISYFTHFQQPTHQEHTICTNACQAHILPADVSIWKCEVSGTVVCAAKTYNIHCLVYIRHIQVRFRIEYFNHCLDKQL
jgi:hypothetical protein